MYIYIYIYIYIIILSLPAPPRARARARAPASCARDHARAHVCKTPFSRPLSVCMCPNYFTGRCTRKVRLLERACTQTRIRSATGHK